MPTVTLIDNTAQKALTTLWRTKVFLGLDNTDKHDSRLTMLINQATGAIEQYTKRRLLSQTYTDQEIDGTGTEFLILQQFPVTALASFSYRNYNDNTDSWTEYDSNDEYRWFTDGRIESLGGNFLNVPKKYKATYTAGYLIDFDSENTPAAHTLPQEIEVACQMIVAALFNTRQLQGLSQQRVGDIASTPSGVIMNSPEVKAILDKYTKPTI